MDITAFNGKILTPLETVWLLANLIVVCAMIWWVLYTVDQLRLRKRRKRWEREDAAWMARVQVMHDAWRRGQPSHPDVNAPIEVSTSDRQLVERLRRLRRDDEALQRWQERHFPDSDSGLTFRSCTFGDVQNGIVIRASASPASPPSAPREAVPEGRRVFFDDL